MKNILVPVDPTRPDRTRSAIAQVVQLGREEPVTARLLRVQPRVTQHVAMCFAPGELHAMQQANGLDELADARAQLDAAGVPHTSTVRIGRSAPTIVAAARELGCDRIVFGQDSGGRFGNLFGSLAEQVRHLLSTTGSGPQVIGS
jgi:nucleotide-binding universal stress UspA family protein